MAKVTIYDMKQLAKYAGRKVKLLNADCPPPGFIGEQVEIRLAECTKGFVLHNPNLCRKRGLDTLDQIIFDLEEEKRKALKRREEYLKAPFNRFKPEFPLLIEV